ncbi:unnamed protein product [Neospora caninum Liverpool]|uniref:Malaria antigen, related n=1 Tax=Neospora caninum (strain Liverpool) TaxID=572307 RepID=F0VQH1_NEOCL|nr:uncharacterized protein NCLIV_063940 [Neospora caninum Liverpool]CBZ55968.1 unnamed protein product [Neospora caninum Liverpool]CEL70714.1 TPA: Malaria antigen, related [Neospora caninum Liverpool]|eukprot:XP_003885994.1 uncharacterized protein NCLIV_063940 [Neospora caninum Liverpool]
MWQNGHAQREDRTLAASWTTMGSDSAEMLQELALDAVVRSHAPLSPIHPPSEDDRFLPSSPPFAPLTEGSCRFSVRPCRDTCESGSFTELPLAGVRRSGRRKSGDASRLPVASSEVSLPRGIHRLFAVCSRHGSSPPSLSPAPSGAEDEAEQVEKEAFESSEAKESPFPEPSPAPEAVVAASQATPSEEVRDEVEEAPVSSPGSSCPQNRPGSPPLEEEEVGSHSRSLSPSSYNAKLERCPKVVGVRFDKTQCRWLAGISINGRTMNKYFPVYKYGFDGARRMAVNHRLACLRNQGKAAAAAAAAAAASGEAGEGESRPRRHLVGDRSPSSINRERSNSSGSVLCGGSVGGLGSGDGRWGSDKLAGSEGVAGGPGAWNGRTRGVWRRRPLEDEDFEASHAAEEEDEGSEDFDGRSFGHFPGSYGRSRGGRGGRLPGWPMGRGGIRKARDNDGRRGSRGEEEDEDEGFDEEEKDVQVRKGGTLLRANPDPGDRDDPEDDDEYDEDDTARGDQEDDGYSTRATRGCWGTRRGSRLRGKSPIASSRGGRAGGTSIYHTRGSTLRAGAGDERNWDEEEERGRVNRPGNGEEDDDGEKKDEDDGMALGASPRSGGRGSWGGYGRGGRSRGGGRGRGRGAMKERMKEDEHGEDQEKDGGYYGIKGPSGAGRGWPRRGLACRRGGDRDREDDGLDEEEELTGGSTEENAAFADRLQPWPRGLWWSRGNNRWFAAYSRDGVKRYKTYTPNKHGGMMRSYRLACAFLTEARLQEAQEAERRESQGELKSYSYRNVSHLERYYNRGRGGYTRVSYYRPGGRGRGGRGGKAGRWEERDGEPDGEEFKEEDEVRQEEGRGLRRESGAGLATLSGEEREADEEGRVRKRKLEQGDAGEGDLYRVKEAIGDRQERHDLEPNEKKSRIEEGETPEDVDEAALKKDEQDGEKLAKSESRDSDAPNQETDSAETPTSWNSGFNLRRRPASSPTDNKMFTRGMLSAAHSASDRLSSSRGPSGAYLRHASSPGSSHSGNGSAASTLLRSRRPWASSGAVAAGTGDSWAREAAKLPLYAGMQYDAVSKCFRVKLQSHRRAFSVVRRGVREAHLLAVEALKNDGSLQEEDEEDFRAFYSGRSRRNGASGDGASRPGVPGDAERRRLRSSGRGQDEAEDGYRDRRPGLRGRDREEDGYPSAGGREGLFRDSPAAYGSAASFGGSSHGMITRGATYCAGTRASPSVGLGTGASRFERGDALSSRFGASSRSVPDPFGAFSNGLGRRDGKQVSQKAAGGSFFSCAFLDEGDDDDDAFAPLGGLSLTKNAILICLTDLRDACLALCFSTVAEQEERRRMVQQHIFHVQDACRREMVLPYLHLFECLLLLNQLPHEVEVAAQRILFSALDMHARAAVHTYFPNYFRGARANHGDARLGRDEERHGRVGGRGASLAGGSSDARTLAEELMLGNDDGFPG